MRRITAFGYGILSYLISVGTMLYLVGFLAMTVYIFIGIAFEERALLRQFGDRYRAYRRKTPMLIPRFGGKYVTTIFRRALASGPEQSTTAD